MGIGASTAKAGMSVATAWARAALRLCPDEVMRQVREDYAVLGLDEPFEKGFRKALFKFGFRSIFHYRLMRVGDPRVTALALVGYRLMPPATGIEINAASVGGGLSLPHRTCVISADEVGKNVVIGPGVVIGYGRGGRPTIKDGVHIGANATVFGKITIGEGACVGAGAVLTKDVPDHVTVVGNPARPIVRKREGLDA